MFYQVSLVTGSLSIIFVFALIGCRFTGTPRGSLPSFQPMSFVTGSRSDCPEMTFFFD